MNETINKLQKSPLFNLSLSSKELFHSNFLYWVGKNYKKEFGELFSKYLIEVPAEKSVEVKREKDHIDLRLYYTNGQEILIENKVKSIPYYGQLEKYSEKHCTNKNYILLSLTQPSFFENNNSIKINESLWHYLSYSDLQVMLNLLSLSITDEYHQKIIDDYCIFISGLIELNEYCDIKEGDLFDFHSIKTNKLYQDLIDLRLHDFYLKKKYELLSYQVFLKIKERGIDVIDFSTPLDWSKPKSITLGHGMTRSQGLMDLKYLICPNISLGIQIQGEHYRMVVEDRSGTNTENIAKALDGTYWFNFSKSFPDMKVYPDKVKGFNEFGKTFIYKSIKLGTNIKVDDIIKIVLSDVESINLNYNQILDIFNKIVTK